MTVMTGLSFNATEVKPDAGFSDPVPAGWYNAVVVTGSEVKPTKDGTGTRANIRFKILDGQYANRLIFNGYNIKNASPKAEEIGRAQFSALLHAIGVLNLQDLQQLYDKPLKIRAKIIPAKDGYEAKNEVTTCKNINDTDGTGAVTGGAAMPPGPNLPPAGVMMPPAGPAAMPSVAPAGFAVPTAAQPWPQPAPAPAPQTQPQTQPQAMPSAMPSAAPATNVAAQPAWAQGSPSQPAPVAAQAAAPAPQPLPPEAAAAATAMPAWAQQQPAATA